MTQDRPRLMQGRTQAGVVVPMLITASGRIKTDTALTISGDLQIGV